jgi:putative OPT family oligopeptide transporter
MHPSTLRTPAEIERHWFEHVYQGDRQRQLTVRAAVMGMLLGMVMSVSNLYLGLKSGTGIGGAITACVLAYAVFATLHRMFPRWFPPFGILENNAMQSCASAAGLVASSGMISAIPAMLMIDPRSLPENHWYIALWLVVISLLGVFLAVPAKRQMINIEQLPFPDGTAAATTMRGLHGGGESASRQTRALGIAGAVGALLTWFREASWTGMPYPNVPGMWGTDSLSVGGYPLPQLTIGFEGSLLFVGLGAIMSFRQTWSLLLGALVNYLVLVPMMLNRHAIAAPSYTNISLWSLWIGVSMLVTSGLLGFALQWRMTLRAFSAVTAFVGRRGGADDPMERIEVPGTWFVTGFVVLGLATIWLGSALFHIAWWMGLIAVLSCFFLVMVAARVTGETSQTPNGALSKITQLTFGALDPTSTATNLMTANITAGATAHAGDLLGDLKSGYLLGANPRQQFVAQFLGVLAGGLVTVPIFFALIPDASLLGTTRWPAPAAIVWKAVAMLVAHGFGALHPTAQVGLIVGAVLGILLPILEIAFPTYKAYIPSATGVGLAFTIPGLYCISMFLGGLFAMCFRKMRPGLAEEYTIPVASGLIAGETLMGALVALLSVKGWLG